MKTVAVFVLIVVGWGAWCHAEEKTWWQITQEAASAAKKSSENWFEANKPAMEAAAIIAAETIKAKGSVIVDSSTKLYKDNEPALKAALQKGVDGLSQGAVDFLEKAEPRVQSAKQKAGEAYDSAVDRTNQFYQDHKEGIDLAGQAAMALGALYLQQQFQRSTNSTSQESFTEDTSRGFTPGAVTQQAIESQTSSSGVFERRDAVRSMSPPAPAQVTNFGSGGGIVSNPWPRPASIGGGSTITTQGEPASYAMPGSSGSNMISTPGGSTWHVTPRPGGGSTISTPGGPTLYVTQRSGGGSMISTPGGPTSYITPTSGGGSTISTPGGPTTYVTQRSGGGSMISTPGGPTAYVTPTSGGGSTISTPGGPTTYVTPTSGGSSTISTPGR